jgi:hypothetical protein
MDLLDKSNIIKKPTKLLKIKEDSLIYNKKRKKKKDLSLAKIDNNNEEFDKDKINLENINYLENDIFNKKASQTQSNSFHLQFNNSYIKNVYNPLLINKNNIFANKLIRNFNKKEIQINIFQQEISMKKLLTANNNKNLDNKYEVIKDEKDDTINNKNKILNIIRIQTKSNFNNKYRVMFKSSNKKKRNLIQNYFSLIKKDLKYNYEPINLTSRKLCINKIDNFPELSYRLSQKKKISKDILKKINNINITHIRNKEKNTKIFIPILNTRMKEDSKIKY